MTTKAPPDSNASRKNLFLVTITGWVLLPNQRVRGHGEQTLPIFRAERSDFQKFADQVRLQFKILTLSVLHSVAR
jgi:hypothetical protein